MSAVYSQQVPLVIIRASLKLDLWRIIIEELELVLCIATEFDSAWSETHAVKNPLVPMSASVYTANLVSNIQFL